MQVTYVTSISEWDIELPTRNPTQEYRNVRMCTNLQDYNDAINRFTAYIMFAYFRYVNTLPLYRVHTKSEPNIRSRQGKRKCTSTVISYLKL